MVDLEADEAVVDQEDGALLDLRGEVEVVERDVLGGAVEVLGGLLGGDDEGVAGLDGDLLAVLEQAGADLGALGVEQDGYGDAELGGESADLLDHRAVVLVGTVREVEASDVHAVQDELAQNLLVLGSRTHGANDLGLLAVSHVFPFLQAENIIDQAPGAPNSLV